MTNNINKTSEKVVVLLTSAINPKGVVYTKRSDPELREKDYIHSLERWLTLTPYSIIFCDSSGYDLKRIHDLMARENKRMFEVLSFDADFPREYGKGYGELLIIKHVIENSKLVHDCDYLIKSTGRYFVKNICKIVKRLLLDEHLYISADLLQNLTFADSKIFVTKPEFLKKYLFRYHGILNDSEHVYFEHVMAMAICEAISDRKKWLPLPYKPIIMGHSGTGNFVYADNLIRNATKELGHKIKNYMFSHPKNM
jgi:hypothetical protein